MLAAVLLLPILLAAPARAQDRHEGYYYPEVTSNEMYHSRINTLPDSDRTRRIGFVTGVTAGQTERPYAPITAMFAKGTDAEKLILVGLQNGPLDTLYRARAVLAMLTATARTTAVFRDLDPQSQYTFLDLLKLLGFTQITVSDGKTWAHRIDIH
ncbi:molybdopterin-guanine dinucleotide biosynthesis protein A [Thalassobaculum sp.]|uniref:molybdopterin-guanine dinucleotide biosynthesis protein A n=1 Tax=Thalassobaculum sp. TaxID=2022740 RepID=UPI0032EE48C6